jgi:acetylglutamate kinase
MMCMEATTYGESVSSTPSCWNSESRGPMQYGITYIVRPRIEPVNSSVIRAFMSSGAIQLFVGPASRGSTEQMNVRSSTRATSVGSEAHQNELGFLLSSSRTNVPASTSMSVTRVHSSREPSHHTTRSGRVSSATSSIQASRRACPVGAASMPGIA